MRCSASEGVPVKTLTLKSLISRRICSVPASAPIGTRVTPGKSRYQRMFGVPAACMLRPKQTPIRSPGRMPMRHDPRASRSECRSTPFLKNGYGVGTPVVPDVVVRR